MKNYTEFKIWSKVSMEAGPCFSIQPPLKRNRAELLGQSLLTEV